VCSRTWPGAYVGRARLLLLEFVRDKGLDVVFIQDRAQLRVQLQLQEGYMIVYGLGPPHRVT
jgi:hypothetical protein